jgi:hypothetical protein
VESLSYEQFGHHFVHRLVTPARIERELKALLAAPIEGMISRLPAELLTAKYSFQLLDVRVTTRPECLPRLALRQRIAGTLALSVRVLGLYFRFTLQVVIRLEQEVRTYEPLTLKIETEAVTPTSIDLQVDAHGLPSEILDRFNIIERAVRAEIVDEVNRRINSGGIARATTIDVSRIAEHAQLPSSHGRAPAPAEAVVAAEPQPKPARA